MSTPPPVRGPRRILVWGPWVLALGGLASTLVLPGPADGPAIRAALVVTLTGFFSLLLLRLVVTGLREPDRRLSLFLLAGGLFLWAAGSATLNASEAVEAVAFPSPGEALFLASYLGMAAFLVVDAARRSVPTAAVWLEAAVVCSGGACLTAFAVLTPLSSRLPGEGTDLLLALLYPLVDALLALIVLGQALTGLRERTRRTALLATGFLGLAAADSSLVVRGASDGTYASHVLLDALWGVSLGLLVVGACRRPEAHEPVVERGRASLLLATAAVALVVLVLAPTGSIGPYVTVPAVVALVCTGARMLLALRDAQGAAEALRLSMTDELTGLPNRRALLATADQALEAGGAVGLMLLDLDGFKDINDTLGHQVGDDVLVVLAGRMAAAVGGRVMVTRLGGDEFAMLAPFADETSLFEIGQEVRSVLQTPMRIDSLELSLDASIGITVAGDGDSSTELLRRADIAMYEAKQSGSGTLLFDSAHDGFSRHRLLRGEELRLAIEDGQLAVHYQPQIDPRTHEIVAMEALVRWEHPTEGLLGPIAFLSDARRAGLMTNLSTVVTDLVIADARSWRDAGFSFRACINWAPQELLGGRLPAILIDNLQKAGLPGGSILIEVTEDSFLSDPERARSVLAELGRHGVETAIDDYGTGFSSLAYLRDLPLHELKIDRSFVSTLVEDERSAMIVRTTTQMAHGLGLRLVAEGVEDAETAQALMAIGADVLQGYHIARPMPADDVSLWVQMWNRRHVAGRPVTPVANSL